MKTIDARLDGLRTELAALDARPDDIASNNWRQRESAADRSVTRAMRRVEITREIDQLERQQTWEQTDAGHQTALRLQQVIDQFDAIKVGDRIELVTGAVLVVTKKNRATVRAGQSHWRAIEIVRVIK